MLSSMLSFNHHAYSIAYMPSCTLSFPSSFLILFVSHNPPIKISNQKQIAPDKALWLKNSFVKLHTLYSQSQRNEKDLLVSASNLNEELKVICVSVYIYMYVYVCVYEYSRV